MEGHHHGQKLTCETFGVSELETVAYGVRTSTVRRRTGLVRCANADLVQVGVVEHGRRRVLSLRDAISGSVRDAAILAQPLCQICLEGKIRMYGRWLCLGRVVPTFWDA
jgi:hypothetical protein